MCVCVCVCVRACACTRVCYSMCPSVVVELEAELNTESILRWKQDILDNIKDESGDHSMPSGIPFLLLGSKQDRVSSQGMC